MTVSMVKPTKRRVVSLTLACLLLAQPALAVAQIMTDGSLGPSRTLRGPDYTIGPGLGQTRGPNLFHSFRLFNINTGESATFTGPVSIKNIVSRVTGDSVTTIDGLLATRILGANLYLLNPRGVVFGPNAILDVSGAFHVTTADYIRLADGGTFQASLGRISALTVAPPVVFGFLGPTPAPITIFGSSLEVPAGRALSIVGGDVVVRSALLSAPSGRITIASAGSASEVVIADASGTPALSMSGFERLGRIEITGGSLIDASGGGAGTVAARSATLLIDSSAIFADALGSLSGARVGIDVDATSDVIVTDGALVTTDVFGAGHGGDIRIAAPRIELSDGAAVLSRALPGSTGDGGGIFVLGADRVWLSGGFVQTATFGPGRAGDIEVRGGRIIVDRGAFATSETRGSGPGGALRMTAAESLAISGRDPGGRSLLLDRRHREHAADRPVRVGGSHDDAASRALPEPVLRGHRRRGQGRHAAGASRGPGRPRACAPANPG